MTEPTTPPAQALAVALGEALPALEAISESASAAPRAPGKWSRKQVLGHLIDSAINNQERFVRAQGADRLVWPGYAQETWVEVQRYQERPWKELVRLWAALNEHLVHLMRHVPEPRLLTPCLIGEGPEVTLGWLMSDYVRHLRHHLDQIGVEVES